MANELITMDTIVDGLSQTCSLKEKVNNQNGQMLS